MGPRGEVYFGQPDASRVTDASYLDRLHITQKVESGLKYGTRSEGRHTVVGIKGSGKTDLRKHVQTSDMGAKFFLLSAHDNTLGLNAGGKTDGQTSGRIKNAISVILLRYFVQQLANEAPATLKKTWNTVFENSSKILHRLSDAATIDLKVAKIDLSVLLRGEANDVVQNVVTTLVKDVVAALNATKTRGYILIDDVEIVIPGIEQSPAFLEGLVWAITDINDVGGDHLHALAFVKHGLWRLWFEHPAEYDRLKQGLAFLSWDRQSLVDLIAKRIADKRGLDSDDTEALWKEEFDWKPDFADFDSFASEVTSYCVNGPRDIIALCNSAAEAAGDASTAITIKHIRQALDSFSEEKLFGLEQDYGTLYPGIAQFVVRVFDNTTSATMSAVELAQAIEDRVLTDEVAQADISIGDSLKTWPRNRLALLMFQIGVVGFSDGKKITYAIDSPTVSQPRFMAQAKLVIHPAFRPHLGISAGP
ncbi:P-loop ATPase, Sll1717 family [Mycolicibacterium iranicum]|uniref:P-loop ATPase, Sll1717 family n=1 Tax=Mycolicibacterium iranicum TaxID=912594 RepID=UPI000AC1201A|nr:hypothetical protein [Mycolicibacterium iranicum]